MSWRLAYNHHQHLIEYVFEGAVLSSEVGTAMSKGATLCHEHGCYDVLIDSSGQEQLESIMVLYDHATRGYEEEGIERHHTHIAVVLPKSADMFETYCFYEDVCRNNGWLVQLFDSRASIIVSPASTPGSTKRGAVQQPRRGVRWTSLSLVHPTGPIDDRGRFAPSSLRMAKRKRNL